MQESKEQNDETMLATDCSPNAVHDKTPVHLTNQEEDNYDDLIDYCSKQYQELLEQANQVLDVQDKVGSSLQNMIQNIEQLNLESLECTEQYLQNNLKDQQRKIIVIAKLCELIDDQATAQTKDTGTADDQAKPKEVPPFSGVDSSHLTK